MEARVRTQDSTKCFAVAPYGATLRPDIDEPTTAWRRRADFKAGPERSAGPPCQPLVTVQRLVFGRGPEGNTGEFETRIDQEPPASTDSALNAKPVEALLDRAQPSAILEVESSQSDTGTVLPEHPSAIVLTGAKAWNPAETRNAIQSAVQSLWTTSNLGVQWVQKSDSGVSFDALDGLAPIETATRDKWWVVANDPKLMSESIRQPVRRMESSPARYAAAVQRGCRPPASRRVSQLWRDAAPRALYYALQPGHDRGRILSRYLAGL